MQHPGGADMTAAPTVSHELLSSKHTSSSLGGTARTADFGQRQSRPPRWLRAHAPTRMQVWAPRRCWGPRRRIRPAHPPGMGSGRSSFRSASAAATLNQPGVLPAGRRIASRGVVACAQPGLPRRRASQNLCQPPRFRRPRLSWCITSTAPRGVCTVTTSERLRSALPAGTSWRLRRQNQPGQRLDARHDRPGIVRCDVPRPPVSGPGRSEQRGRG